MIPVSYGFIEGWIGKSVVQQFWSNLITLFFVLSGLAIMLCGLMVVAAQIYFYLKDGQWISYSLIDGLAYFDASWHQYPRDWIGLWELSKKTPLSIFMLVVGCFVFFSFGNQRSQY